MNSEDNLIRAVVDELGFDVYHIYPDSKRMIPDAVVWGIGSACVIEFLKGLGAFNELGKAVRTQLTEVLHRWRTRDDFEPFIQTLNLQAPITVAIQSARQSKPSAQNFEEARQSLEKALTEFGLHEDVAREHATKISELIAQSVKDIA